MKIDASEFEGSINALSETLERKLRRKVVVYYNTLQVDNNLTNAEVKDALKHVLHKLEPQRYRVVSESGFVRIRKLEFPRSKTKHEDVTPPSATQTLPYFFPR